MEAGMMARMGAAALLVGAMACPAAAQDVAPSLDPVTAAPASHRVLLDNDDVRVLRVTIAPGATEPVHDHRWRSVMVFEQPQPITYILYAPEGGRMAEVRRIDVPAFAADTAEWAEPEGPHAVHNRGTQPFVALRVELKGDAVSASTDD
jgi:hypothetical protein